MACEDMADRRTKRTWGRKAGKMDFGFGAAEFQCEAKGGGDGGRQEAMIRANRDEEQSKKVHAKGTRADRSPSSTSVASLVASHYRRGVACIPTVVLVRAMFRWRLAIRDATVSLLCRVRGRMLHVHRAAARLGDARRRLPGIAASVGVRVLGRLRAAVEPEVLEHVVPVHGCVLLRWLRLVLRVRRRDPRKAEAAHAAAPLRRVRHRIVRVAVGHVRRHRRVRVR